MPFTRTTGGSTNSVPRLLVSENLVWSPKLVAQIIKLCGVLVRWCVEIFRLSVVSVLLLLQRYVREKPPENNCCVGVS